MTWDETVRGDLGSGLKLVTTPPPTSGPILAAILATMANFNLTSEDMTRPVTYQRFIEACKYGFAERTLLGDWRDPESGTALKDLVTKLTDPRWALETAAKIQDDWTSQNPAYYGAEFYNGDDDGTSHTSVIAPNGDAVAVTSTINTLFGSGLYSDSTGIFLNNQMDDFSTPGVKNAYGIEPSEANFIKPGNRYGYSGRRFINSTYYA